MISLLAAGLATAACALPSGAGPDASSQAFAYAMRSVQIVAFANANRTVALNSLLAPTAEFEFGSGDVGQPMGRGIEGARAMALALKPATYAFNGWDYIPMARDACGKQTVEVEFITADGKNVAKVKFEYDSGLLVSAKGWSRSRFTGIVSAEQVDG